MNPNIFLIWIYVLLGIDEIGKTYFVKKFNNETQEYFYSEIVAGFSKNHRADDEGSRSEKGCVIPFAESKKGFNPGRFIGKSIF